MKRKVQNTPRDDAVQFLSSLSYAPRDHSYHHRQRVVREYDKISGESKQQRRESPDYALRTAQNNVKRQLFTDWLPQYATRIWDVGAGEAGDFQKLRDLGIKHVTALEPSMERMTEGKRRMKEERDIHYDWVCADFLCSDTWPTTLRNASREYDAVIMMFSMHYFVSRPIVINKWLAQIYKALKPGGRWIVCCVDMRAINSKMKDGAKWSNSLCSIEPIADGHPDRDRNNPWMQYRFKLGNRVNSIESVICWDSVTSQARLYGFEPLTKTSFADAFPHFRRDLDSEARDVFDLYQVVVMERPLRSKRPKLDLIPLEILPFVDCS